MAPWTDELPVLLLLRRPVARCRERFLNWLRHEIEYAQPQTTQTSAKKFWGDVTGGRVGPKSADRAANSIHGSPIDFDPFGSRVRDRFANLSFTCT
jgi:hypothetical protein